MLTFFYSTLLKAIEMALCGLSAFWGHFWPVKRLLQAGQLDSAVVLSLLDMVPDKLIRHP